MEVLLERLINERVIGAERREGSSLPVWHLGGGGPYHRRDIYDDVR